MHEKAVVERDGWKIREDSRSIELAPSELIDLETSAPITAPMIPDVAQDKLLEEPKKLIKRAFPPNAEGVSKATPEPSRRELVETAKTAEETFKKGKAYKRGYKFKATTNEIRITVDRLKNKFARGPSGAPGLVYMEAPLKIMLLIVMLIQMIMLMAAPGLLLDPVMGGMMSGQLAPENARAPRLLFDSFTIGTFKGKLWRNYVVAYRPTTLAERLGTILDAFLEQRISFFANRHLPPQQYGYRAARSAVMMSLVFHEFVREWLEGARPGEGKRAIVVLLVDTTKAFDAVVGEQEARRCRGVGAVVW